MAWYNNFFGRDKDDGLLVEATKSFENKGGGTKTTKHHIASAGEGVDDIMAIGFGKESIASFNGFYNKFINVQFQNKRLKIQNYRMMAEMPEISTIIEDICIESTQEDTEGKILTLEILDQDLKDNENIVENLNKEFDLLFHRRIRINNSIMEYIRTYYIDSEVFIEKIVNKDKPISGIINIKKLPTETMDFDMDPVTGRVRFYFQLLKQDAKPPMTMEEGMNREDVIVFYPEQIAHIDYGIYGGSKKNVIGYLEKCKQPFNQLKLLETSVVIYRIVKAPERLVFNIDTGAMPRDKALKFVEKVKKTLTQKISYDPQKGVIENAPDIMSMMDNYFLPQSSDGRGSSISSIGGDPSGFAQLDDIYYFARKLYIALKYPISRVIQAEERRQSDSLFMGGNTSEITIDEIRWAKFLERNQQKFSQIFTDIFLLHLEFKGLKREYDVGVEKINVNMTPPNDYKNQMNQLKLQTQVSNYTSLSNNNEFSKTYLMEKFLKWDEQEIKANSEGFDKDKLYLKQAEF